MKKSHFILPMVLLAIGAGGGWLLMQIENHPAVEAVFAPTPKLSSEEADFAALEQAAVDSCMCKRANPDDQECGMIYNNQRQKLMLSTYGRADVEQPLGAMTACAPISTETDYIKFSDGERCVVTSYYVNGASRSMEHPYVCTKDEARAVETAYEQAWLELDGSYPDSSDQTAWSAANARANRALDEMLLRILAGETVVKVEPTGGCAG